jgi:hypothetical protein
MSFLDESLAIAKLARSLEAIKRGLETPLEKSLRAEVSKLTERLEALTKAYDTARRDAVGLHEQIRHRHHSNKLHHDDVMIPPMNATVSIEQTPFDNQRQYVARVMVNTEALRGVPERAVVDCLAEQLVHEFTRAWQEDPKQGPERTTRASGGTSTLTGVTL